MTPELPILFQNEIIAVHELSELGRLDDKFAERLEWPAGRKGYIFASGEVIPEDLVLSQRFTYSRKLEFHINFSARKEWLKGDIPVSSGVRREACPGPAKLGPIYLGIKKRIFSQLPWYASTPEEDKSDLDGFVQKLESYRLGYWECGGLPAGIIAARKWKDYMQRPVDWISWVAVEECLSKAERAAVHGHVVAWLRENTAERVECLVQSFNMRSIKFFLKMGFKPVSVHVYKGKGG